MGDGMLKNTVLIGNCLETLDQIPAGSVHCCVTSPPYWGLRDYGVDGQLGQEATPDDYVQTMVDVFRKVRIALHESGTVWLNVGDSYFGGGRGGNPAESQHRKQATNVGSLIDAPEWANIECGIKPKDLCLIPWRLAIALQADGWYVRSVIVWAKKSCMPESVTDRPTNSWEPIFLLAKSASYYFDAEAVRQEPTGINGGGWSKKTAEAQPNHGAMKLERGDYSKGANIRNVWHLGPEPYAEAHFATFPTEIPRRAIMAGTSEKGCCPKCFAPWARVLERSLMEVRTSKKGDEKHSQGLRTSTSGTMTSPPKSMTLGWQRGCECNQDPTPCTVLDPFLGSGTTAKVAQDLGRNWIGCELNPTYEKLIKGRTAQQGMFLEAANA